MEGSVLWCSCQGQRWRKLLEEVAKGALSEAALVDEARGSQALRGSETQCSRAGGAEAAEAPGVGARKERPRPKG